MGGGGPAGPRLDLDYLPVAGSPSDPLLPFLGGNLPRMLSQLRDSYDCVIIDSPPLLAVAEARLLVAMADKVLLAVQWGRTQRVVAQDALDLLRDHGHLGEHCSEHVGAVLTQVDLKKHAQYRYGGLESLHPTRGPAPRLPNRTSRRRPATLAMRFRSRAPILVGEQSPLSQVIGEPLSEPRLYRALPASGRQIGDILMLGPRRPCRAAREPLSFVHSGERKISGLDMPHVAALVEASHDDALPATAGSASALKKMARHGAVEQETPARARTAPVAAAAGHRTGKGKTAPHRHCLRCRPATGSHRIPAQPPLRPDRSSSQHRALPRPLRWCLLRQYRNPRQLPQSRRRSPTAPPLSPAEIAVLVARGDAFVGMRDIASARLFYLRAAEAGDGRAAMRMAVTFDPEFLDRANMVALSAIRSKPTPGTNGRATSAKPAPRASRRNSNALGRDEFCHGNRYDSRELFASDRAMCGWRRHGDLPQQVIPRAANRATLNSPSAGRALLPEDPSDL